MPKLSQSRIEHNQAAIETAALRVFTRRGYEAASIQDIAREAGLSKSSVYHHVASKEKLLSHALERAFKSLGAALDDPAVLKAAPLDALRTAFERAVTVTLKYHQEVDLLQRIKGNSPVERDALARRRKADTVFTMLVRNAIRAGELRDDIDPRLITRLMLGMSNSITQWYQPGGKLSPEQIAAAAVDVVFAGLALIDPLAALMQ